jgi:hypothetical protein
MATGGDSSMTSSSQPLDDSEFLPLLDMLIESFACAGLSASAVKALRRRACER